MDETTAEDAWRTLDLDALESDADPIEAPEDHWRTIALAVCGRTDALACLAAIRALASCDSAREVGGRSVGDWIALGQTYVDSNLLHLGAAARFGSGIATTFPQFFDAHVIGLVDALNQGELQFASFAVHLLKSKDPLLWFEGAPLLLRLAVQASDGETLGLLHRKAIESYSQAPWFTFLERQCQLFVGADFAGASAKVSDHFASAATREGNAALALLGATDPEHDILSLAGVQGELDPGQELSAIVRLDHELLATALDAGAVVVVHEERPVHPGFAHICGHSDDLLLVDSMHGPGRELRTWEEQESHMSLYGNAALVVFSGADDTLQLQHDEGLAMLGATERDQEDPESGRARQEELARRAVESCIDIPRAWQLHGQALLAQLKAEELESESADGPIERWYGHARTRFDEAEWSHQIYAQALEEWGLFEEAAIAWNDASGLDAGDARNLLGIARTRAREGLVAAAIPYACRALCANPSQLDAWRLRAELASSSDDNELASEAAAIVLEVAPDDPSAHRITATEAELRGALPEALEHFDQAAESGGVPHLARASVLAARLGDFAGALARALASLDRGPEDFSNHLRVSECFLRTGDYEDAVGVLDFALSRFGPQEALVQGYAQRILDLLDREQCAERIQAFVESWSEYERPLVDMGTSLASAGYLDLAVACFEAAHRANRESLNPRWQQVQSYMRHHEHSKAAEMLEPMLKETSLPHVYALWIELQGETRANECWDLLGEADASRDPVLVWGSARYLAEKRGDAEAVEGLTERLLGVPAGALNAAIGFLLQTKAFKLGAYILPLLEQHPDADESRESTLHLQALLADGLGQREEAAQRIETTHNEFSSSTVTWDELSMVLRAGNADVLRTISEKALRRLLRGSPEAFGDGYTERAYLAAAEALVGDYAPLETLLAENPGHLSILGCALRVAVGRSDKRADAWRDELISRAPGIGGRIVDELASKRGANA